MSIDKSKNYGSYQLKHAHAMSVDEVVSTLSTSLSENSETIEEVYEPFLIQQGFIIRTPRGRQVTEKAYNHLGRNKNNQNNLFN